MGCCYLFGACHETRPSLSHHDIEKGKKKRGMDELIREYMKEKLFINQDTCECEWWEQFETNFLVKSYVKTKFPYKRPRSTDSLIEQIKNGSLFWR